MAKAMHTFEQQLAAAFPPQRWQHTRLLVAVSGGADSVALLVGICRPAAEALRARIVVGHYNHGLRGQESADDEAFVRQLAERWGLTFVVGRPQEPLAGNMPDGLEAAARDARYAFLTSAAETHGARYLITAHTANDQVETILHRIVRGTGVAGLSGIARCRVLSPAVSLVRPLLDVHRNDVLAYLADIGQPFRTDTTNADTTLTRNRIRHTLLPMLRAQFNPAADEAVLRLGSLTAEMQQTLAWLVEGLLQRAVVRQGSAGVVVRAAPLAGVPEHAVRELLVRVWQEQSWPLQSMGHDEWRLLAAMLRGDPDVSPKRCFPGNVLAEGSTDGLLLIQRTPSGA